MKRNLTIGSLILAAAVLAAAACQKAPRDAAAASPPTAARRPRPPPGTPAGAAPAAAPRPRCRSAPLLSAAEVSAVMGKTLVQDGCTYGLDPAAKEKAMAESQEQMARGPEARRGGRHERLHERDDAGSQKKMGSVMATR